MENRIFVASNERHERIQYVIVAAGLRYDKNDIHFMISLMLN